jgi:hypothetical protein
VNWHGIGWPWLLTIAYCGAVVLVVVVLSAMSSEKPETMLTDEDVRWLTSYGVDPTAKYERRRDVR